MPSPILHLRSFLRLFAGILGCAWICASTALAGAPTRAECMEIAASYANHRWTASEQNIFHGLDRDRINVQTPDRADGSENPALWKAGEVNVGVPYKWGGFDTIESFDKGIRNGRPAGDLYTQEKRRLGGKAVSGAAVGVDCSGFVSRCWKLARKQATSTFSSICITLPDAGQLRAGDIMNTAGGHVRLFAKWTDESRTRALFYEAEPYSKVRSGEWDIAEMLESGFRPMRYRQLRD
ncbi:MAG: hypothetical protein V4710_11565 [Verrucomicrobiota bacterium]